MGTANDFIEALGLSADARLDKRVAKKVLLDAAPFVSADKKLLNEAITEFTWVAVLKPDTCGLRAVDDGPLTCFGF
jgi:hypothetical protein